MPDTFERVPRRKHSIVNNHERRTAAEAARRRVRVRAREKKRAFRDATVAVGFVALATTASHAVITPAECGADPDCPANKLEVVHGEGRGGQGVPDRDEVYVDYAAAVGAVGPSATFYDDLNRS